MIDINSLVGKPYDKDNYHCYHFIEEVLDVPKLKDVHVDTAKNDIEKYKGLFKELIQPENYCIVVLGDTHVGIWYRFNIYHNDTHGVRCESERVMRMKYKYFTYYKVEK